MLVDHHLRKLLHVCTFCTLCRELAELDFGHVGDRCLLEELLRVGLCRLATLRIECSETQIMRIRFLLLEDSMFEIGVKLAQFAVEI